MTTKKPSKKALSTHQPDPKLNKLIDDLHKESDRVIKKVQDVSNDIIKHAGRTKDLKATQTRTTEHLETIDRLATVHLESFIKLLNPGILPLTVHVLNKKDFTITVDGCKPIKYEVGVRKPVKSK